MQLSDRIVLMQSIFSWLSQYKLVDWGIIFIVLLCAIEGYAIGALYGLFDIAGFLLAFGAGLMFYTAVGSIIGEVTHLSQNFNNALGFIFAAIMTELIFRIFLTLAMPTLRKLPWPSVLLRVDRLLGIIPGVCGGLVLLSFLLTVITVFPVANPLKDSIKQSVFGNSLVADSQIFEKNIAGLFGGKPTDLLTFLTIEPQANSVVKLDFSITDGKVDSLSEEQMVVSLNQEREKIGLSALTVDPDLQKIAEEHSSDMLARSYFSHYTPEGKSPFDRMTEAGISYQYAGENLALSPSVPLAMDGLMQSPGHRANILSPAFHKVGVGVVSAGIYGEMFSQEFTD